jgi:hypothetical protein
VVYTCILYQDIRNHRNDAIARCKGLPSIDLLPPRRQVVFDYRGCSIGIKVACVEEQCNLAIACALKGLAVETGLLKPIFAEDTGQTNSELNLHVGASCTHDVAFGGFGLLQTWLGYLCVGGASCLPDPGRTSWCTLAARLAKPLSVLAPSLMLVLQGLGR